MTLDWIRSRLRAVGRGLMIVLSQLPNALLLLATAASGLLIATGLGVFLLPAVTEGARKVLNAHRRIIERWTGVEIPVPYRPEPEFDPIGLVGAGQRCRFLLSDPATWRDALWLLLNLPVGIALGSLPAAIVGYGLHGILVAPWLAGIVDGYGYGVLWPLDGVVDALLALVQGVLIVLLGLLVASWTLRLHASFSRSLLRPTRAAELALRVRHLTDTRAGTVDAQAAELRRIERDLHDGAQARLVALSLSIGMAEDLITRDPQTAKQLLAEAREASGLALVELRHLVRGIHPPVLAERGLRGAVQALAMAAPLRTAVDIELPGRPDAPVESAAYFAVAEVLTNVTKHSSASHAWVKLCHEAGRLSIVVGDDGIGGATREGGTGIAGVERRLAAFDGTLTLHSPRGGPTVVTMELPCELS